MLQYQVAVVGNLHLMATVLSILAYFSRRSWLVTGVGLTVRALTPLSIALGGLAAARPNLYSSGGGLLCGLVSLGASWSGSSLPLPPVDLANCVLTTANILFVKGDMHSIDW